MKGPAMTKRGFSAALAALIGWLGFGRGKSADAAPPPKLFQEIRSGVKGAPSLLFIPGLTAPAAAWDGVRPAFETTHDVRTLHLAGMAGAPPQPWTGSYLEAHADAIAQRLDALGVREVSIVGHSLGGALAMMIAARSPQTVARIVVVDQVPFLAQWITAGQVQTQGQAQALAAHTAKTMQDADWRQGFPGLEQRLAVETRDEAFRPQVRAYMLSSDQRTVAAAMGDLLATDLRQRLPLIRQPTLVLMSYDPSLIPVPPQMILSAARMQYAGLPQGEIRLIENSRHWIMHDQREALISAVREFLG